MAKTTEKAPKAPKKGGGTPDGAPEQRHPAPPATATTAC